MKEFHFDCLPSQLYDWARETGHLPKGVAVSQKLSTEILFTFLFPKVKDYKNSESNNTGSCTCKEENLRGGERSVDVQMFYRRSASYEIPVLRVSIVNTLDGVSEVLAALQKTDLLNGKEAIQAKVQKLRSASREKEKSNNKKYVRISVGVVILVVLGMFAFSLV